jgi:hypothetical protein
LGILGQLRAGSGHFQILVRVEIIVSKLATPRAIGRFLVIVVRIITCEIMIVRCIIFIFWNWLIAVGFIRVDKNERKQKGGVGEHHIPRHGPSVRDSACSRSGLPAPTLVIHLSLQRHGRRRVLRISLVLLQRFLL